MFDNFIFSGILILFLGLYYGVIYLNLRDRKYYLLFSLSCLFIAASQILFSLARNISQITDLPFMVLSIFSSMLGIIFLSWFIHAFLNITSSWQKYATMMIAPPLVIFPLFSNFLSEESVPFMYKASVIFAVCISGHTIFACAKNLVTVSAKRNLFFPLALSVVFFALINDTFVSFKASPFTLLSGYAFLLFLYASGIFLTANFEREYKNLCMENVARLNILDAGIELVARQSCKLDKLANAIVEHLKKKLSIDRCSLVVFSDTERLRLETAEFLKEARMKNMQAVLKGRKSRHARRDPLASQDQNTKHTLGPGNDALAFDFTTNKETSSSGACAFIEPLQIVKLEPGCNINLVTSEETASSSPDAGLSSEDPYSCDIFGDDFSDLDFNIKAVLRRDEVPKLYLTENSLGINLLMAPLISYQYFNSKREKRKRIEIGFLIAQKRKAGEIFTKEETDYLSIMVQWLAQVVDNCLFYNLLNERTENPVLKDEPKGHLETN